MIYRTTLPETVSEPTGVEAVYDSDSRVLSLSGRTNECRYFVEAVGSSVWLVKIDDGTDAEAERYCVGASGCECKGWKYRGRCKHYDAFIQIFQNQLDSDSECDKIQVI